MKLEPTSQQILSQLKSDAPQIEPPECPRIVLSSHSAFLSYAAPLPTGAVGQEVAERTPPCSQNERNMRESGGICVSWGSSGLGVHVPCVCIQRSD